MERKKDPLAEILFGWHLGGFDNRHAACQCFFEDKAEMQSSQDERESGFSIDEKEDDSKASQAMR